MCAVITGNSQFRIYSSIYSCNFNGKR
uniref:Uncharacterized protein n=1 Tax=Anguilla anguilla TaxID=7936 RepID=A0A0E9QVC4_ANGAN